MEARTQLFSARIARREHTSVSLQAASQELMGSVELLGVVSGPELRDEEVEGSAGEAGDQSLCK